MFIIFFHLKSIFLEHDFKYLEDLWFTEAQNLTLATCEVRNRNKCHFHESTRHNPICISQCIKIRLIFNARF